MNVFEIARLNAMSLFKIQWVRWVHEGFRPAYTNDDKNANILLSEQLMENIVVFA